MSYLFFMDESGHDHKKTPYEVRGGIIIHAGKLWSFIKAIQDLEIFCFGGPLHFYKGEIKGRRLLDKERYRWAAQKNQMEHSERVRLTRSFLQKGVENLAPTMDEFSAYGQACLRFSQGLFDVLNNTGAVILAAAIPNGVKPPDDEASKEFLRKDQIFLFSRYFDFLSQHEEHGLIVMDETDESSDRKFIIRINRYFMKTNSGRSYSRWIVPIPFFVSSAMTYAIQVADVIIYCINWGYRVPRGMDGHVRPEIQENFQPLLQNLQYRDFVGSIERFGILFVPDPFSSRRQ